MIKPREPPRRFEYVFLFILNGHPLEIVEMLRPQQTQ